MYVLEDKPGKISGYSIRCNQSFLIWCRCIIYPILKCIPMKIIVFLHDKFLDSLPHGSGGLSTKLSFGIPPVFIFQGQNSDTNSLKNLQTETDTVFIQFLLKYSTEEINSHYGSFYLLI